MKIVFIADAHLKGLDDPNQKSLVRFLDGLDGADRLVVLGDLFDFWTGFNEVIYYHYLPVLDSLLRLKQRGTGIIYLEGNHDFSMGGFFTDVLGAGVYPDSLELAIDGKRFYLAHGDMVSMGFANGLWRGFLRTGLFRVVARVAAPHIVWKIAMRLSHTSRTYNRGSETIEKKLMEFAGKKIKNGANAVILGHSHVAGVTRQGSGWYANPGSWAGQMSYLVYESGVFRVERFTG